MPLTLKLIVGLGNPGPEYTTTRHNAGFWFLDRLADQHSCRFTQENKFAGEISRINSNDIDCRLLKPLTYMNESGRSVLSVMNFYKIDPEEVLVVHDEIDFEPGKVRLKDGGGHAGHNGLRDIISRIGNKNFLRLRIGVGHPGEKEKVTGSVLGRPSKTDQALIDSSISQSLEVMPLLFDGKVNTAMTELHTLSDEE